MANLAGYIKLHRKMKNWRWKDHPPTLCLFIHLLLSASYETERTGNGITLNPGQVIISLNTLAKETGLSVDQVRTALSHLQQTEEITMATSKGCRKTVVTIQNWVKYQIAQSDSQSSEPPETQAGQGFAASSDFGVPKVVPEVSRPQSFSQSKPQSDSQSSEPPETGQDKGLRNLPEEESQSQAQSNSQSSSQTLNKKEKKDKKIKKNPYGEGGFVLLSEDEYRKLAAKFGEPFLAKCIEKLANYIGSKGGKDPYKSHYYVINGWVKEEVSSRYPGLMKPQPKATATTTAPEDDPLAAWGGTL